MKQFTGRLRRIDRIHRQGGGFEAAGTLGQSYYTRERERRDQRSALRPALVVLAVIVIFKGFLLASNGENAYREKVATLKSGSAVERVGGFVMAVDPLALVVAGWVKPLVD
ncbi:hypothetical protein [Tropicimonas marinistellae]|uniref:hypothetical protein n=1 Tax=Tropicimonas marinistellae TaxID=1739787 RepID=UPI00122E8BF7|nr:hypothetical protein [Tropicimonas marinistellae]